MARLVAPCRRRENDELMFTQTRNGQAQGGTGSLLIASFGFVVLCVLWVSGAKATDLPFLIR